MTQERTFWTVLPSPIGELLLTAGEHGITRLYMAPLDGGPHVPAAGWRRDDGGLLKDAAAQLDAYFAGELRDFDLPLAPAGSPFQLRVWSALREIPYGTVTSYGQLAVRLGYPTGARRGPRPTEQQAAGAPKRTDRSALGARAVGMANGRNPISIIVPCHRVIGANGTLVGYGGGLDRKRHLLTLEGVLLPGLAG
jgi:methylated-DNA-[protein]-cysteine S-methyltransferase